MTSTVIETGTVEATATGDSQEALAERIARHEYWERLDAYGLPYIRHAERVTGRVPGWAQPAAWLHDVIETTGLTAGNLQSAGLSTVTVDAIVLLTRTGDFTLGDDNYDDYINGIANARNRAGTIARQVKLASLADHVARAQQFDSPDAARLHARYRRAKSVIAAAMTIYGEEPNASPTSIQRAV